MASRLSLCRNGSRYTGMVTDTDLSRKAVAGGLDPTTTPINACITHPLIGLDETETMSVAIGLMKDYGIPLLVVTHATKVIGILSVSGVVRYYTKLLPVVQSLGRLTPHPL